MGDTLSIFNETTPGNFLPGMLPGPFLVTTFVNIFLFGLIVMRESAVLIYNGKAYEPLPTLGLVEVQIYFLDCGR